MAVTDLDTTVSKGPWKWGAYVRANTKVSIPALLWTLHDMGGVIEDSSGRATTKLAKMAVERGMPPHHSHLSGGALSQLMGELETGRWAGTVERVCKARHTFKITLMLDTKEMPPRPYMRGAANDPIKQLKQRSVFVQEVEPVADDGGTGPKPDEPVAPIPDEPTPPTPAPRPDDPNVATAALAVVEPEPAEEVVEPTLPPLVLLSPEDDPIARLFAIQNDLVAATMAIATMATPVVQEVINNADPEQAARLAKTLEENNRLRAKVNTLTETVRAKTAEADAFKRQVLVLQNNLKAISEASNDSAKRERDLARLNGNQKFISARPEPAIAARR